MVPTILGGAREDSDGEQEEMSREDKMKVRATVKPWMRHKMHTVRKKNRMLHVAHIVQYFMFKTLTAISLVFAGRDGYLEKLKTPLSIFVGNVAFMYGILIMALYTANLAAFMTVNNMNNEIENIDDLKKTGGSIAVRCPAGEPPPWDFNFVTEYLFMSRRAAAG